MGQSGRPECLPHPGKFDAAYCTFDSFRHLLTEQAARRHLECVAESLRPGGIYILGFHLLPLDAAEECTEHWTGRHGRTQVSVTLRVLATDRRRRMETLRVSLLVRNGAAGKATAGKASACDTTSPSACTRPPSFAVCCARYRRSSCATFMISGTRLTGRSSSTTICPTRYSF